MHKHWITVFYYSDICWTDAVLSIGPDTCRSSGGYSVESRRVYLTFKISPERNSPGLLILLRHVLFRGSHLLQILLKALQMNPNLPSKCMLDNGIFTINTTGENVTEKRTAWCVKCPKRSSLVRGGGEVGGWTPI